MMSFTMLQPCSVLGQPNSVYLIKKDVLNGGAISWSFSWSFLRLPDRVWIPQADGAITHVFSLQWQACKPVITEYRHLLFLELGWLYKHGEQAQLVQAASWGPEIPLWRAWHPNHNRHLAEGQHAAFCSGARGSVDRSACQEGPQPYRPANSCLHSQDTMIIFAFSNLKLD